MTAHLLGDFARRRPDRMAILPAELGRRSFALKTVRLTVACLILECDSKLGIPHRHTLRSGNEIQARIRTRSTGIELKENRLAEFCFNDGCVYIADFHLDILAPIIKKFLRVMGVRGLLGLYRNKKIKSVTAIDIHIPGYRP